ncbi:hypothetical protein BpHYR1_034035 [Brachionus plicatilis]|uniref:Uncharacterized protein n=1 Tax=Brachionus plicatilis TaxID=10195 RepID=A0A3M7P6G0_BRAPC|nr:hypothetical protein BpHYR1_034035 [Brachionus plicatilis]
MYFMVFISLLFWVKRSYLQAPIGRVKIREENLNSYLNESQIMLVNRVKIDDKHTKHNFQGLMRSFTGICAPNSIDQYLFFSNTNSTKFVLADKAKIRLSSYLQLIYIYTIGSTTPALKIRRKFPYSRLKYSY